MAEIRDPENTIVMELKDGGRVVIELLPDVAPKHAARMKELARSGAYDNVAFHRVIEGFMAQTGDVANGNMEKNFNLSRAGTGGSDLPDLPAPEPGRAPGVDPGALDPLVDSSNAALEALRDITRGVFPAQLVRSLDDLDVAVINGNYALEANLSPSKDAILVEEAEGNPYANFLAVQAGDKDNAALTKLDELLHSPEVKAYIEKTWSDGSVLPAT